MSCVPASCFLIWFVSCHYWLIRVQVCVICECVFKSCLLNSISSGLLVIPGVSTCYSRCVYLALCYPDVVIKDYYFEVISSSAYSSSLPAVCTVTDTLTRHEFMLINK